MIVLDEQLMGRNLEVEIAKWYRGTVQFIADLRPNTVIKDDSIPELLRKQKQPVFVTINETDFWRKVTIDKRFCIICFGLPDSRAKEIPRALRSLLRRSEFSTKAKRMGKVIRVKTEGIDYYTFDNKRVKKIHH
ncbi:MAG: hypothetical protein ACE5IW_13225 [bacterium]